MGEARVELAAEMLDLARYLAKKDQRKAGELSSLADLLRRIPRLLSLAERLRLRRWSSDLESYESVKEMVLDAVERLRDDGHPQGLDITWKDFGRMFFDPKVIGGILKDCGPDSGAQGYSILTSYANQRANLGPGPLADRTKSLRTMIADELLSGDREGLVEGCSENRRPSKEAASDSTATVQAHPAGGSIVPDNEEDMSAKILEIPASRWRRRSTIGEAKDGEDDDRPGRPWADAESLVKHNNAAANLVRALKETRIEYGDWSTLVLSTMTLRPTLARYCSDALLPERARAVLVDLLGTLDSVTSRRGASANEVELVGRRAQRLQRWALAVLR